MSTGGPADRPGPLRVVEMCAVAPYGTSYFRV